MAGYGNTGVYGSLLYKGQSIQVRVEDFLIEQFRKSYINRSSSAVQSLSVSNTFEVITMDDFENSAIKPMVLIEQFKKGYING